jgi:FXSXX-COOH protein
MLRQGEPTMESFSADTESGVESELIDLGAVSMTALRELDDTAFRAALRHVMQQAAHPRVTSAGGSGTDGDAERVD